ncbi:hypothetical protein BaRGS_00002822 [Batillaria attramentaria]|uniref:Uncharacterized protein n=1 Tax=Batillaria attramentaria TaxID=370345 RepID=A0ABD0M3D2_9CAEN
MDVDRAVGSLRRRCAYELGSIQNVSPLRRARVHGLSASHVLQNRFLASAAEYRDDLGRLGTAYAIVVGPDSC